MKIIVQKFGGTSVANRERIFAVAKRALKEQQSGNSVVVVVSAMAGETNRLLELARSMTDEPSLAHQDILLATGEQVTVALLGIALAELGVASKSFLGHQVRIVTDEQHGRARIQHIDTEALQKTLASGKVAIVAGFQGVTEKGDITTIGRGGSDTTAVALAAALHAARCDIFTDVTGVYTADPRICSNARHLKKLSYEEMLELAGAGAKVLHSRCVEIAAKYRVPLYVASSFEETEGTWIVSEEEAGMEDTLVSGITLNVNEAKVAVRKVPDRVGIPAQLFQPLSEAGINVDMIIQNIAHDGTTDVTFTVPKEDLKRALTLAEGVAREVGAGRVEAASDIAKVSVIGVGMRSHAGVAHRMFAALASEGIGIQMISTSEIKVAIVIDIKYAELAVRVLHHAFQLEK